MATQESDNAWQEFGQRWNRFWFTPSDPLPLGILRIGVGLCLCLYLLGWTPDVVHWLSAQGIVSRETYADLVLDLNNPNKDPALRFEYWTVFAFLDSPTQVTALHYLFLAIAVLFTAGVFTRVTSVLALAALMQYVHRIPFITSQVEPLLAMLLLYLCVGPSGATLSVDDWLRSPKNRLAAQEPTWTATVSLRLIQVHLSMFYVMMATAKLQGEIWWRGDAIWTLMSATQSRLLNWSFIRTSGYLINFWTHLHLFYELTFAALIWNRLTRPVVLWLGVVLWVLMLLASGMVNFCLLMLVANLAFVPVATWRRLIPIRL